MFDRKGSFIGRWTFATLQLPEDLKSIPVEHSRSRVLVSVTGTDQATEAVLLAQAPKKRTGQRERNQSDGSRRRFGSATFTRLIFGTRPRTSLLSGTSRTEEFLGRGAAVYGPYGGAGGWAAYNSRTRTYARGGVVYGPYGSRGFAQALDPRTVRSQSS